MAGKRKAQGGSQPDGEDVRRSLDSIWQDYGICAEVHIYVDLAHDVIVEVVACGVTLDGRKVNATRWERWRSSLYTLDVTMMRLIHQTYHALGTTEVSYGQVYGPKG